MATSKIILDNNVRERYEAKSAEIGKKIFTNILENFYMVFKVLLKYIPGKVYKIIK